MKRLIEILLISILLFSLAYIGCKDEAEANEPTLEFPPYSTAPTMEGTIWLESEAIPPPSIFYYDGEKNIEYIPKPEPNEPESANNWIEAVKRWPNAQGYITDNFGNTSPLGETKFIEPPPEPNEPEISELRIICNCGMIYDIRGKELSYKSRHTLLTDFVKAMNPNINVAYTAEELDEIYKDEPELGILAKRLWGYGTPPEPNEPQKVSLGFIPTWPDYIELDKDLWIVDETEYGIMMRFCKGTKIYFKEDE